MCSSRYITSSFPIQQFSCIIHYDESAANEERNLRYTSSMCSLEIHSFKITMNEDDSRTRAGEHIRLTQRGSLITQSGMISQVCFLLTCWTNNKMGFSPLCAEPNYFFCVSMHIQHVLNLIILNFVSA